MYRVTFYVPESHLERVKQALFAAGAGTLGHYDCCAWQTLGTGQFRPLSGSAPHVGQLDQVQQEAEYKVELVCQDEQIRPVLTALLAAHPYETPAYEAYRIETLDELPA